MTDTATDPRQRQLAAAQAQLLRQGLRQADLVKALMDRTAEDAGDDVAAGVKAAARTAAFVGREGWVSGPVWWARGPAWLASVWAVRHNHTFADYVDAFSELRTSADPAAGEGQARANEPDPKDAAAPQVAAQRARRQRELAYFRGREQGFALDTLMRHLLGGDTSVKAAAGAARHTAGFAATNGWARGPLWSAAGMQMLLSRWALEEAVPFSELTEHFAAADRDDADL